MMSPAAFVYLVGFSFSFAFWVLDVEPDEDRTLGQRLAGALFVGFLWPVFALASVVALIRNEL